MMLLEHLMRQELCVTLLFDNHNGFCCTNLCQVGKQSFSLLLFLGSNYKCLTIFTAGSGGYYNSLFIQKIYQINVVRHAALV